MIDCSKPKAPCPQQRERRCLMCSEVFRSQGAHNRVCPRCKLSRRWREGPPAECATPEQRRG